jgi:hypothetical protein
MLHGISEKTSDAQPTLPRESLLTRFEHFEAKLGLVCMCFFSAIVIVGGIVVFAYAIQYSKWRPALGTTGMLVLAWFVVAILEALSLRFYATHLETAEDPVGLHMALTQFDRPVWMRPFLASWWLANCVSLLYTAHQFCDLIRLYHPTLAERMVEVSAKFHAMWSVSVGCNVLVLLGVASMLPSTRLLQFLWRARIAVDLVIAFAISAIGILSWPVGGG